MENRINAIRGLVACGILAIVTIGYIVMAASLPAGPAKSTDLGAGVYPLWVGIALGALTIGLAAQSARQLVKTRTGHPDASDTARAPARRTTLVVIGSVLLTVGYVAALEPVGFIISTTVYLATFSMIFRGRKPVRARDYVLSLIFGFVTACVMNAIFVYLFGVLLPLGIIGF